MVTTQVEEAQATHARLYGRARLDSLPGETFGYKLTLTRFGAATCLETLWPGGARVEIPSLEGKYVFLAASPDLVEVTLARRRQTLATAGHALVTSVGSEVAFGIPPGLRVRNLAIDSAALEDHWLHLTGKSACDHLHFQPVIETRVGDGASVLRVVTLFQQEVTRPQASPLLLASLRDTVCTALLTGLSHSGSHLLRPLGGAGPGCVRRAEEYIRQHAAEPLTLADIVAVAGAPARALQIAFQKARGMTPMDCLRAQRFEIARARLSEGDPATTVASVAAALGFGTSPGRFAIHYRERFGESPSETLAKARR